MSLKPARPVNQANFAALTDGVTLMRASFTDHAFGRLSHSLQAAPGESLRTEATMRAFLETMLSRHGERPGPIRKP